MHKRHAMYSLFLLLATVSPIIKSDQATIYIDNYYGASIGCMVGTNQEFIIPNNKRTDSLGDTNSIKSISIRTTGTGSSYGLSPYYSLSNELTTIAKEYMSHPNANAIIAIMPSNFLSRWNIEVRWERKDVTVKVFEEKSFITQEEEWAKTTFGAEYAKKVHAIASADYTKAETQGMVNLWKELQKSFEPPKYAQMQTKDPLSPQPNLQKTEAEIKSTIDSLSRSLQRYKGRGLVAP